MVYIVRKPAGAQEGGGAGIDFLAEDTIQRIDKGVFLKPEEMERFASDPLLQEELKISNKVFEELEDVETNFLGSRLQNKLK